MKSAERKNKRIRHCYPRKELYHRFIHDDTMMYYNSTAKYSCSCMGNIFCISTICKDLNKEDLNKNYAHVQIKAVAVIDRKYKRIIVNTKYNQHSWYIIRSLPADYTIFYTNDIIPFYDILKRKNSDLLLKIHSTYLVKHYCNYLIKPYAILQNKCRIFYDSIDDIFSDKFLFYKEIKSFVEKYKINNRKWYRQSLIPKYTGTWYKNWNNKESIIFSAPSIKDIINGTIFNDNETLKLKQVEFYSNYCYGYGIPFKDVINNWNKVDWNKNLINKYNRNNIIWDTEKYPTFNQFIEQTTKIINQNRNNQIRQWEEESNKNYQRAKEELEKYNSSQQTVIDWRENKNYHNSSYRVSYRRYIPPRNKNDMGCWTTDHVSNFGEIQFANTQLKLVNDEIITSKHARVPLSDAIRIFKLFQRWLMFDGGESINFLNGKKIGIYSIRYVKFMEKITDNNTRLGKQEWVFVIGCHHLWLDDIIDFIHYYNLENEFDLI